ncbi:hypothetical protein CRD14_01895 [Corynebacterium sp. LK27]|nr:hypothetical protein [Corynebacterium sp. LK27]OHR36316.1 hypothetical protein HMPREF2847_00065 [Corynebacterium sp. HMSC074C03]
MPFGLLQRRTRKSTGADDGYKNSHQPRKQYRVDDDIHHQISYPVGDPDPDVGKFQTHWLHRRAQWRANSYKQDDFALRQIFAGPL